MMYTLIVLMFAPMKESKASWYGPGFNGRVTANGEIYNSEKLTCASPNLPFNTLVQVTNMRNNKSVIVRVNDRGPFEMDDTGRVLRPLIPHPRRDLDLSKKAFTSIANIDRGVIKIKYKIIKN